jgi:hypothetical protein
MYLGRALSDGKGPFGKTGRKWLKNIEADLK